MKLTASAGYPCAGIPGFKIPLERATAIATIAIRASTTKRPARGAASALVGVALATGCRLSSRPKWFANTGTIAIVAIAILRWAAKAVASRTAATAISGASLPFGLRIMEATAAPKKESTRTKYFFSRLPAGAVVSAAIRGFQSVIVPAVVGFRIE